MKTEKDDRRSRRTRQILGSALVELLLEKHFSTITVQNILDRANIGRSTFYEHYADKEDLLMGEIKRVILELETQSAASDHFSGSLIPSLEFFRHIEQHRRLFRAFVLGRSGELLTREFQAQVSKLTEQNIRSLLGNGALPSIPLSMLARFITNTFIMVVLWWFEDDFHNSPEQINEMFQKLVMPGLQAALGLKGQ